MKNGEIIQTNDDVVTDSDGLILLRPSEADDGIYICRAIVVETGELAERNIKVEVSDFDQGECRNKISMKKKNIVIIYSY